MVFFRKSFKKIFQSNVSNPKNCFVYFVHNIMGKNESAGLTKVGDIQLFVYTWVNINQNKVNLAKILAK